VSPAETNTYDFRSPGAFVSG